MHLDRRLFLTLSAACCTGCGSAHGAPSEEQLKDSEGLPAWLYTPSRKGWAAARGEPSWLVVGVHGLGGDGKGAMGAAGWCDADDVIVLGPTFETDPAKTKGDAYQSGGGRHEKKLKALIAQVSKEWKIHPKVFLHGFSGGAQFAHRFAFRNPELVAGVSAHSAGTWAGLDGGDRIDPAAKGIPFFVSCGEDDLAKSFPGAKWNRLEGSRRFAEALRSLQFSVEYRTWPKVGHFVGAEAEKFALDGFNRVKAAALENVAKEKPKAKPDPKPEVKPTPEKPAGNGRSIFQ